MSPVGRLSPAPFLVEIGPGVVRRLPSVLERAGIAPGSPVAVVVGPGQGARVGRRVVPDLVGADLLHAGQGTVEDAVRLGTRLRDGGHRAVVGIGGGRTLDTAKLAASLAGLPMVVVATSLAHDGLASPVAVLERHGRAESFGADAPVAVVVDLDMVRSAPLHTVGAGVADAISNLVAVADWELARDVLGEPLDGVAALLARTAAESVLHRTDIDQDSFLVSLAEALVVSGLAMLVAGSSRPCSGSDHEISHAIDRLYPGTAAHGEQVGVSTLFSLFLRADDARADLVDACLLRHGLPRVPSDLGLSTEEFAAAVVAAPATRPDRYTILEHLDMSALETRRAVLRFVDRYERAVVPTPLRRLAGAH